MGAASPRLPPCIMTTNEINTAIASAMRPDEALKWIKDRKSEHEQLSRMHMKEAEKYLNFVRTIKRALHTDETVHPKAKNPDAVALGRLGGLKGGKARAEKLTPSERRFIAQHAARQRWARA